MSDIVGLSLAAGTRDDDSCNPNNDKRRDIEAYLDARFRNPHPADFDIRIVGCDCRAKEVSPSDSDTGRVACIGSILRQAVYGRRL